MDITPVRSLARTMHTFVSFPCIPHALPISLCFIRLSLGYLTSSTNHQAHSYVIFCSLLLFP